MKKREKKSKLIPIQVDDKKEKGSFKVGSVPNAYLPYEAYPNQLQLIERLNSAIINSHNALVESPTGTGKTLCLLTSAFSALMSEPSRKHKILYLTRTHSQIAQVIEELKKTPYKLSLNIVASRDHFCINKNLQSLKGRLLDKACQEMCTQNSCKYREDTTPHTHQNSNTDRKPSKILQEPQTLEQLKSKGSKQFFCPFYLSRAATETTNMTIMPYNYLLDWNLLQNNHISVKDSIIIFDEAHNIDSLAEEGSSFEITTELLTHSIKEIKNLEEVSKCKYLHRRFEVEDSEQKVVDEVKYFVANFSNQLKQIPVKSGKDINYHNKEDILKVLKSISKFTNPSTNTEYPGADLGNYEDCIDDLLKIQRLFHAKKIGYEYCAIFFSFIKRFFMVFDSEQAQDYILSFSSAFNSGVSMKLHCLNASFTFDRIRKSKPRSIILCSGTLEPLQSWERDLGMTFQAQIQMSGFVTSQQLYASVLSRNHDGGTYDFSFQYKNRESNYEGLSQELLSLEQTVPNGIVVAFSTYELLQKAMPHCLKLRKKVFYESKSSNFEEILQKYSQQCQKNGAFLFIVTKGRFAEGINFSDQLCRCLLIVGIPFLPMMDFRVMKKKQYLTDRFSKETADAWYMNQTFRAVNQAIGRVIRSKKDYGCVILVDQRYLRKEIKDQLPVWFKSCLRHNDHGEQVGQQIESFFEAKSWENSNGQLLEKQIKFEDCLEVERTMFHNAKDTHKLPSLELLLQQQTPIKRHRQLQITDEQENPESPQKTILEQHHTSTDSSGSELNEGMNHFPWLDINFFLQNETMKHQRNATRVCQSTQIPSTISFIQSSEKLRNSSENQEEQNEPITFNLVKKRKKPKYVNF